MKVKLLTNLKGIANVGEVAELDDTLANQLLGQNLAEIPSEGEPATAVDQASETPGAQQAESIPPAEEPKTGEQIKTEELEKKIPEPAKDSSKDQTNQDKINPNEAKTNEPDLDNKDNPVDR